MDFTRRFFPPHGFLFKGGGAPPPGPIQAPPAPSASPASVEVTQAKQDAKRNARAKTGINSTILAGDNPLTQLANPAAKNTILGGG